jgi:hypothetical protein
MTTVKVSTFCTPGKVKQAKNKHAKILVTPVIPETQEAAIRRTALRSHPQQRVHETLAQKTPYQKGLVEWHKV